MTGFFNGFDYITSPVSDDIFPATLRINLTSENVYCNVFIYGGIRSGYKIEFDESSELLSDQEIIETMQAARQIASYIAAKYHLSELANAECDILFVSTIDNVVDSYSADYFHLAKSESLDESKDDQKLLSSYEQIVSGEKDGCGFVYCLSDQQGHYKLGYSKNVDNRIKQLSTQPPFELKLMVKHQVYDMRRYEAALHNVYNRKRLRGEWFALSHQDLQEVINGTWVRHYFDMQRRGNVK